MQYCKSWATHFGSRILDACCGNKISFVCLANAVGKFRSCQLFWQLIKERAESYKYEGWTILGKAKKIAADAAYIILILTFFILSRKFLHRDYVKNSPNYITRKSFSPIYFVALFYDLNKSHLKIFFLVNHMGKKINKQS